MCCEPRVRRFWNWRPDCSQMYSGLESPPASKIVVWVPDTSPEVKPSEKPTINVPAVYVPRGQSTHARWIETTPAAFDMLKAHPEPNAPETFTAYLPTTTRPDGP